MAVFGAADRDVLLADFGVDLTAAGTTVKALLDFDTLEGQDGAGRLIRTTRTSVRIKAGAVSLTLDQSITVDGLSYKVRSLPMLVDDGAWHEFEIVRA